MKLQRQFPAFPLLMAKRDISIAFRSSMMRPDSILIFITDIAGDISGWTSDWFIGHLAMPFGRVGSPAYFKLHTDAIAATHNHFKPGKDLLVGSGSFERFSVYG